MRFGDLIWYILPKAFKKTESEIWKLCQAIGKLLDQYKEAIFKVRRAWIVETAEGRFLDLHGKDRGIPRLPGEFDDVYRKRLLGAYTTYALGGTNTGIVEVLKLLGFNVIIEELYKIDPNRKSEMNIIATGNIGEPLTATSVEAVLLTINKTKASHAKLASFIINYQIRSYRQFKHRLNIFLLLRCRSSTLQGSQVLFDGQKIFDGSWCFNTYRTNLNITEE